MRDPRRWHLLLPVGLAMVLLYRQGGAAVALAGALAFLCCAVLLFPHRAVRRTAFRGAVVGTVFSLAASGAHAAGVRLVLTPSVPEGVYLSSPRTSPRVGQYVCFEAGGLDAPVPVRLELSAGHLPRYWYRTQLMKRVGGVAGSTITHVRVQGGDHIAIDGELIPQSRVHARDGVGHRLPRAQLPLTLEPGQVWLISEHSRGYDSRYFGPVGVAALRCTARPLWTL